MNLIVSTDSFDCSLSAKISMEIFPEEREEGTRAERNGEARGERGGDGQRRRIIENIEITFDH